MNLSDHNRHLLELLLAAQHAGQPTVLATIVKTRGSVPRHAGSKMLVHGDGRISGTIGGGEMESRIVEESLQTLRDGQPRLLTYSLVDPERGDPGLCGGEVDVFLEPYRPPETVLVIGCGHVGQALVRLASWLGYRVVAYDDRSELANQEATPDADLYLTGTIENVLAELTVTPNTYMALLTRNVNLDREILPHLLKTPAPYIGIIGSRRRWTETVRLLREDGLSDDQLGRLRSPIGLALNAETPQEIALSIMAEITMLRHQGAEAPLSEQKKAAGQPDDS
jgi:xanthine dehydrogenase accessory factor